MGLGFVQQHEVRHLFARIGSQNGFVVIALHTKKYLSEQAKEIFYGASERGCGQSHSRVVGASAALGQFL